MQGWDVPETRDIFILYALHLFKTIPFFFFGPKEMYEQYFLELSVLIFFPFSMIIYMYLSVAQMSRFLIKCGVDYGDILLLNKLRLEGALVGDKEATSQPIGPPRDSLTPKQSRDKMVICSFYVVNLGG